MPDLKNERKHVSAESFESQIREVFGLHFPWQMLTTMLATRVTTERTQQAVAALALVAVPPNLRPPSKSPSNIPTLLTKHKAQHEVIIPSPSPTRHAPGKLVATFSDSPDHFPASKLEAFAPNQLQISFPVTSSSGLVFHSGQTQETVWKPSAGIIQKFLRISGVPRTTYTTL